jgi:hypothetical protein
MATNINVFIKDGLLAGNIELLASDAYLRLASRSTLSTRDRELKVEKKATTKVTESPQQSRPGGRLQDPPTYKRRRLGALAVGSGATNDEEDSQDGGSSGPTSPGVPFLIFSNSNNAKDDNFNVFFNGARLNGFLNFNADDESTTYLFLWPPQSEEPFVKAKAPSQWVFVNTFMQTIAAPTLGQSVLIFLENAGQNFNGNFGQWYAGFSRLDEVSAGTWGPPDGGSQTLQITWPSLPAS